MSQFKNDYSIFNLVDLKNESIKMQVQVGDLVINTYGDRWKVSDIVNGQLYLRTQGSPELGAMDLIHK